MLLSQELLNKVKTTFCVTFARQQGYADKDINAMKRNDELDGILEAIDFDDERWFTEIFQDHVQREGVYVTLGELLEADESAVGGADAQSPINLTKVKDILMSTEVGMCHLLTSFVDIELVRQGTDGEAFIGGGRHRRTAYYNLFIALGFTHEQALNQVVRCQLITFTSDEHANRDSNLYVIASNKTRNMTGFERKNYVLTSITGISHKDTDALIESVEKDSSKLGMVSGTIWYNLAQETGEDVSHPAVTLTPETYRKMGAAFCRDALAITAEHFHEDGSTAKLPSGKARTYKVYQAYAEGDIESFLLTGYDALCEATIVMTREGVLPSNTALEYKTIVSKAVDIFDAWCQKDMPDEFRQQPLPLPKAKAVKAEPTPAPVAETKPATTKKPRATKTAQPAQVVQLKPRGKKA